MLMRKRAVVAGVLCAVAGRASATWSIVVVDVRTGEIAVASATCLTGFDLQANTPVLVVGVGGATAQSAVDQFGLNRTYIRDQFYLGTAPDAILTGLAARDTSHQSRQYGMVDALGRPLTFTGANAGAWAGGTTGQTGDLVYAVQGNVLTGQPVVDLAVQAIINTPGDIPAKVMAAMEAARLMGGDGRCSCNASDADGCGSPPPEFEKSAHIAYMIVARPGDRDGSNGNYRTLTSNTPSVAIADFDEDGRPDLATCGNSTTVSILRNVTEPGALAMFGAASTTPVGPTLRDIAPADMNADGHTDVVGTDQTNGRVVVMRGLGDGTLQPLGTFVCGTAPSAVAVADFNADSRPDVTAANSGTSTVGVLLHSGAGALGAATQFGAGAGANLIEAGDLDGDGDTDLVVGTATARTIEVLLNNGNGVFTAGASVTFAGAPFAIAVADLNDDGLDDIAATITGDNSARVLLSSGGGLSNAGFLVGGVPNGIVIRDFDNDTLPDLGVVNRTQRFFSVLRGAGDGSFGAPVNSPIGYLCSQLNAADFNADGWIDAATPMSSGSVTVTLNQQAGGGFNAYSGLAGGDYFMDFNVANQQVSDPDPVFQLRDLFDAWRAALVGVPDAAASSASFDAARIRAGGRSVATLTVSARDWSGAMVAIEPADVTLAHDAGVSSVGPPVANGDGTVSIPVMALAVCAVDAFEVTLTGFARPVVLMPPSTLELVSPADIDLDGFVTGIDFDLYVDAFESGDALGDYDGDGFVTGVDYDLYVQEFENPC